jgi:hypothetical protein
MEWLIAGAALFFFTCLVAWAFSLYSKEAMATRARAVAEARRREASYPPIKAPYSDYTRRPSQSNSSSSTNWGRLLELTDPATARRLMEHAENQHPDRSEKWVIDKVIRDLIRDRSRG